MTARALARFAMLAAAAIVAAAAPAQDYPTKPIRIIVGYTTGGGNDLICACSRRSSRRASASR